MVTLMGGEQAANEEHGVLPVASSRLVSRRIRAALLLSVLGGLFQLSCSDGEKPVAGADTSTVAEEQGTGETSTVAPPAAPAPVSLSSCNNQPFECCVQEANDCMIAVPAGPFVQGSKEIEVEKEGKKEREREGNPEETPRRLVTLSAYYMEKYEVTNANFRACVAAGVCSAPLIQTSNKPGPYYGDAAYDLFPVIYVNRDAAEGYCRWKGRRLPTEAEWEKAARGPADGSLVGLTSGQCTAADAAGSGDNANCNVRPFPWGGTTTTVAPFASGADCAQANIGDVEPSCVGDTSQVGSYPAGASPYGLLDLAGNVFEWVSDGYDASYYGKAPSTDPPGAKNDSFGVYRGGAWDVGARYARTTGRLQQSPAGLYKNLGFRCAKTP